MRCYTYTDYTLQGVTMECFESTVPAIFLSYAPTFGDLNLKENQKKTKHIQYFSIAYACFDQKI